MKILIIGLNYAPEAISTGKYTSEMAQWLAAGGHDVRVMAAPPYYPAWRVHEGYSSWRYRSETIDGIRVLRCPLYVPRHPTGLKRIVHSLSFGVSSLLAIPAFLRWRPDVVMAVEPPFFGAVAALAAARLCGAKAWLHVQDFEIDAAFQLGILKTSPLLCRVVHGVERATMRRFGRISSISEKMVERLRGKGVPEERRVLFRNWVDTERIRPLGSPSPMRATLGLGDETVIALYAGNLGEKQGLETVLEAARMLRENTPIRFIICGDGAARERLRGLAGNAPNIGWLPLQPVEELNNLLNMADIHLLPQRAGAADVVMPSKLTGILASGRPVVATAVPGTEIAETVCGRGVMVPPEDPAALARAIRDLAADPGRRRTLGAAARRYAEVHLERKLVLSEFERRLERFVRNAEL